jgi:dihydrofolate reductase
MGRVLYEEWAAYWPEHADQPFGDVMNSIKKYVVSNSLQTAEWQNSEIISGDAAQKLTDIKAEDDGDINMSGSATTVRWLLREGLLTSSTYSYTRSWSATAWLGSFRRTSPPSASSYLAHKPSRPAC